MRRLPLYIALLAAAGLSACAAVTTPGGRRLRVGSSDFRRYVESVFREQNRVETQLNFALAGDDLKPRDRKALQRADTVLLEACAGLNEIAASRENNEQLGKLRQLRAARRAPRCERAAAAARGALNGFRRQG